MGVHGEVLARLAAVNVGLPAFAEAIESQGARGAVVSLRSWGASSGVALAWGINAAVLQLTERVD